MLPRAGLDWTGLPTPCLHDARHCAADDAHTAVTPPKHAVVWVRFRHALNGSLCFKRACACVCAVLRRSPADCRQLIKRLTSGNDPKLVPASGPAPALLRFESLQQVAPWWENVTAIIEADAEAVKVIKKNYIF